MNISRPHLPYEATSLPLTLSLILSLTLPPTNSVRAQIIPDTTLGSENSIVTPITSQLEQIDGGAIRGSNLFHSFVEFGINEGRSAYFANPTGIANIFSRVTGNNPSHLYGTLGVLGEANLFFLNPNGIVFGPNASLDLRGSFVASTAHNLIFPNGEEFSAVNPNGAPLLTIDVPVTLSVQFESDRAGSIVNGGNLAVDTGETLSLVGGTVVNTGQLVAPSGEVAVLAVPGMSEVEFGGTGRGEVSSSVLGLSERRGGVSPPVADAPTLSELVEGSGEDLGLTVTGEGVELGEVTIEGRGGVSSLGLAIASGTIDVSGEDGGKVQILGDRVGLISANIDASGGGEVLVGGDYQGKDSVLNASRTFVSEDSIINADGEGEQDGGRVIIWADGTTGFYGNISAIGGSEGGNGGFVEVSGKESLVFRGEVDTSAVNGEFGTLLLDPTDIEIKDGNADGNDNGSLTNAFGNNTAGNNGQVVASDSVPTIIYESELEGLPATTNVIIQASNNITIEDLSDNQLSFPGAPGGGTIKFNAGGDFRMEISDDIITRGRDLSISGANVFVGEIDTFGLSNSGNIEINSTNGSIIANDLTASGLGDGGNIVLSSTNGSIQVDNINAIGIFGNGGNVALNSINGGIETTDINTLSPSKMGGNVTLSADRDIAIAGIVNSAGAQGSGTIAMESRNGAIDTTVGTLNTGSSFFANPTVQGMQGDILLDAAGTVAVGLVNSSSTIGDGGNIFLRSRRDEVRATGSLISSGSSVGMAGNITFEGNGNVAIAGSLNTAGLRKSGDIAVESNNGAIAIEPSSIINTGSLNSPLPNATENGGNIRLQANDNIEAESAIFNTVGNATSGNIELDSRNGEIELQATVLNTGKASSVLRNRSLALGNVRIRNFLSQIGSNPSLLPVVEGSGGNVELSARSDIDLQQSFINTSGGSMGSAGGVTFDSNSAIALEESFIGNTFDRGTGQDFNFNSQSFFLNRSAISTRTFGNAEAGDININATNFVELRNNSFLGTRNRGSNPNGDITINTKRVTVGEGSVISTSTDSGFLGGNSGRLRIEATDLVEVFGSSGGTIPSSLVSTSIGAADAGTVDITTDRLILRDGGLISTATADRGQGGDVNINANSLLISGTSDNQLITSSISVDTSGAGNAGNLMLNTKQLTIENGGIISASVFQLENNPSFGGRGGNIEINALDVLLQGTSRDGQNFSSISARSFSSEPAGSITLNIAGDLRIEDKARISVNSDPLAVDAENFLTKADILVEALVQLDIFSPDPRPFIPGSGGNAGNINISARNIFLSNQGQITAETSSGEGGNINLNARHFVLMRDNSLISTTAGTAQAGGNGGNIGISALFVLGIPRENSDISANAFTGNGGRVTIDATSILGLTFRPQLTPFSDITASSRFGAPGVVILNTLGIDPSRGLQQLTDNPLDAEIAEGCGTVGRGENVEFVDIGRGGTPALSENLLRASAITTDWIELPGMEESAEPQNIAWARGSLQLSCGS
ncbi:MAG: filamentous hemagglutinin N-terminal domain-containing protein [Cyanobacteriota bacterium]|nr:filamentous hemagglutinin N-terminal domain-containing protein [Cyanobacteriota bacterium]